MSKDVVWPGWWGRHWVGDRREERHDRDITWGGRAGVSLFGCGSARGCRASHLGHGLARLEWEVMKIAGSSVGMA